MLRKNKTQLIIASMITLLPMLAGTKIWLPMPLIILAVYWICIWISAKDPKNKEQSSKVFGMILWLPPVISLVMGGTFYAVNMGMEDRVHIVIRAFLGLMFVVLGNYLPKCRQNHTIGIKVPWALKNEENWDKTHRFAGRLWVLGGVVLLATMFIPIESASYVILPIALLLAGIPAIYSYVYYRKQLKEGTATKEKVERNKCEKGYRRISKIIGIAAIIVVGTIMITGELKMQFGEKSFSIETTYWQDTTVDYADIEKIEYRKQDRAGERVLGFGGLRLLAGEFRNNEFGNYTRYSYTGCDSCIVLSLEEGVLVINGKNIEETERIYNELTNRSNK